MPSEPLRTIGPGLLNDVLPVGVIVTDIDGVIQHSNLRATELVGYGGDELIGRSVLQFISEADVEFLVDSLAGGVRYHGQVMGPARLKFRDRHGVEKWTEYWAFACPEAFGFAGYVITMSIESVSDNLAQAVREIATGQPVEASMAAVAGSLSAFPLSATGTILLSANPTTPIGTWPFLARDLVEDPQMPWHDVMLSAAAVDIAANQLPQRLAVAADAAGFEALWLRPVLGRSGAVEAVLMVWVTEPGPISANQARHLDEVVGVARLALDHHDQRSRLQAAALMDTLTGLGNRLHLTQRLAAPNSPPEAVLYIDLDNFKRVNDTYGHETGDLVLTVAGRRIAALVRDHDSVYRIGGDEFVVILQKLPADNGTADAIAAVAMIAQRVVDALAQPINIGQVDDVRIGASVGVATRQPGDSGDQLIRRSDRALLRAKGSGKSQWHLDGSD